MSEIPFQASSQITTRILSGLKREALDASIYFLRPKCINHPQIEVNPLI